MAFNVVKKYGEIAEDIRVKMKEYVDNRDREAILELANTSSVIANYVMSNPFIPVNTAKLIMMKIK